MNITLQEPIQKVDENFYGMNVFRFYGKDYIASTIEQAELSARCLARESLDLMETDLILSYSTLPPEAKTLLRFVQNSLTTKHDVQVVLPVIYDFNGLVEEALRRYGRAHFLGFSSTKAELSLSDFPPECAAFIRAELQATDDEQICIYLLG